MSKENITFRLDSGKRAVLDEIAAGVDRNRPCNGELPEVLWKRSALRSSFY